jgi:glycosyltransferase involved in cell wall biosynthesis
MARTVIHFIDSNTMGGCEQVLLSLVANLDRGHWNPIVFHRESTGIAPLLNSLERLEVPCFPVPRIHRRNLFIGLRHFISQLRETSPDVFHVHLNWPLACRHELVAARLAGVPAIVATAHLCSGLEGVRFGCLKQAVQVRTIDKYIAVSGNVKEWLCRDLQVAGSKVQVVRNGVSVGLPASGRSSAVSDTHAAGRERSIVLTTARLHRGKGINYLLQAAKLVPEALFVIAGDGPDRNELERHANELGVAGQVQFLGYREDIPELLAASDLFVLPSLYEALGLSVIEAMAAAKPVVASAVGGLKESVVDGVTGLLVPPKDPESLAAAIRRVLSDHTLATSFGEAGRTRAIQFFSAEAMVSGVTQVYDELLAEKSSSKTIQNSPKPIETRVHI